MADQTFSRQEALAEAYKRGILPPDQAAAYEEAQRRGLIANAEPIDLPTTPRIFHHSEYERPEIMDVPAPGSEAAAKGIDVTTGSPVGRTSSSFAENEAMAADNFTRKLSEHYGQEVRVSKGEFGLEFLSPETGRRTLIDEAGASLRDIGDIAGASLPVAGTVAGAVVGTAVGWPNVGAGVGATIGEVIKRTVGHLIGVRGAPAGEEALGATGVGVTEAIFGKVFEAGVRAYQGIRRIFKPSVLSSEAAEVLSVAGAQDQLIAEEIAKRTGKPFQPFTGQTTKDPTLLGHQSSLKTDPETARRFRKQEVQNESTLESLYDDLNPAPDAPSSAVGRSVQLEARDQTRPRVEGQRDITEQAVDDLEAITRELPMGENSNIVSEATAAAASARKVVKDAEDEAWDAYKLAIGLDENTALSNITVPVEGELKVILRRFAAEAEQAVDPDDAAGLFRLMPKSLTKDGVDLWQLQRYLSSLKRRSRLARKGEVATDPHGRDVGRLITAVQKQRDAFLKKNHPKILNQAIDAELQTTQRAALFDEGLVSQLIRRENGEWLITDSQLVGGVIGTGDRAAMEHLVSALGKHPAGVPTLQRSFLKYYRNEVVENGVPTAALHRRFMENHKEAVDVLFPGDKSLQRLGNFEAAVTQRLKRFDAFEKAIQKSFRGRVQDISPEHVVTKFFTDKFDIKDVSRLMRLAEAAGVGDLYSEAIRGQIRSRFYSPTSGISLAPLDKFLTQNNEKLIAALGGRYVRDMRLLMDGLAMIRTSATGIATTRRPGLLATISEGLARSTVARPLSPHGVALTRIQRFNQRAQNRAWAQLVEDPKVLRAIIANKNTDIETQAGARILGQIAGGYFLNNPPSVDLETALEGL